MSFLDHLFASPASPFARHQELLEVARLYPSSRFGVEGDGVVLDVPHRGFVIRPRLASDHPLSPPHVFLSPEPVSGHYYVHQGERVARLCWCSPAEWSPRLRVVAAVGAAMRFINEYLAGRAR